MDEVFFVDLGRENSINNNISTSPLSAHHALIFVKILSSSKSAFKAKGKK